MNGNTISVERVIDAEPARIFALLADASKHSEFDGSGTVQGTRGGARPLELGSRFGMSMKWGVAYSTVNTVIELEPQQRIAWQTTGFGGLVGGRIWRYELEPVDGGTLVRETWDISEDKQRFLLKRSSIPGVTEANITRTLERLAQAVSS
ncbi:SRPBCC family protein [Lolliginicoccus levis]|uniref:SRPBCC family protein n=1 Tax=Lolliginicoccus levis TaxID=2919542 RepID=UPI00241EAB6B|nr:SRPBCC family protein [Lolliginicoccus levis]